MKIHLIKLGVLLNTHPEVSSQSVHMPVELTWWLVLNTTTSLIFSRKRHILPVYSTPSRKHDTVIDKGNQHVTKVED